MRLDTCAHDTSRIASRRDWFSTAPAALAVERTWLMAILLPLTRMSSSNLICWKTLDWQSVLSPGLYLPTSTQTPSCFDLVYWAQGRAVQCGISAFMDTLLGKSEASFPKAPQFHLSGLPLWSCSGWPLLNCQHRTSDSWATLILHLFSTGTADRSISQDWASQEHALMFKTVHLHRNILLRLSNKPSRDGKQQHQHKTWSFPEHQNYSIKNIHTLQHCCHTTNLSNFWYKNMKVVNAMQCVIHTMCLPIKYRIFLAKFTKRHPSP